METGTFAVEAQVEETHWWFVGRRRLFAREIGRLGLQPEVAVIDIGTGTGSGLRMLRDIGFRNVRGVDASDEAIRLVAAKGLGPVERGSIYTVPVADASQRLVVATDVIEHVDDDMRALREVARAMGPAGRARPAQAALPVGATVAPARPSWACAFAQLLFQLSAVRSDLGCAAGDPAAQRQAGERE